MSNSFLPLLVGLCGSVLAAAAFAGNLSYSAEAESAGMSTERLGRIAPFIQQYVDNDDLVGATTMIARRGEVVQFETFGVLNRDTGQPVEKDSIFRIYSMTKPITTLAVMMLYEEGRLRLTDPVSNYLPDLSDLRVVGEGGALTKPEREITVQMLMTHTAGLTYGVFGNTLVDMQYRDAGVMSSPDNAELIRRLGKMPLQFEPGTRYHYSVATDVLGALVEAVSGQSLGDFLQERIFAPLQMRDTFFEVPAEKLDRFGTNHSLDPRSGELTVSDRPEDSNFTRNRTFQSGGGGLLSTTEDYMRFSQMLLNGGELAGQRIIGKKTLEYMTQNHLPGIFGPDSSVPGDSLPGFVEGTGFGLGFAVVEDTTRTGDAGSVGEYYWGALRVRFSGLIR